MKVFRYTLMLLLMSLSGCSVMGPMYDPYPPAPTSYYACFVDSYTSHVDCGYYSYRVFWYRNYFSYYNRGGIHFFYHNGWRGRSGVVISRPEPVSRGRVIQGKGYSQGPQYKEAPVSRRAVPRNQGTQDTPRASQVPQRTPETRRQPPKAVPRPQVQKSPPVTRKAVPKPKKPGGG